MPRFKLSDDDVSGIIYGYKSEGMTLAFLAAVYGISRTQVWRIVNGKQRTKRVNASSKAFPLRSEGLGSLRVNEVSPSEREILRFLKKRGSL